jgi:hypothetical protein
MREWNTLSLRYQKKVAICTLKVKIPLEAVPLCQLRKSALSRLGLERPLHHKLKWSILYLLRYLELV